MRLLRYLLCACAAIAVAQARAEDTPLPTVVPDAPFGLRWLASQRSVQELGTELGKSVSTPFGTSLVALHLPREFPDLDYSVLSFGYDDRLIRITALGSEFNNDGDGHRVRARYRELRELLDKAYGAGKEEEHLERGYDGEQYARGLHEKKNRLYTVYRPGDMMIELAVVSEFPRTRWRLIFEYTPGLEQLEVEQRRRDKDALGASP